MNEIAIRTEDALAERIYYAQTLAGSGLLPKQYRQQPENILYAIEYGRALGLDPINAMNSVHVIEGRPSPSSGLISALVRKAGHTLRVRVQHEPELCAVAQIIRADDPHFTFEARWNMARAQKAGVAGKQVWRSYPEAMLKARAITEVAREACEEALLGFSYTPEELGHEVDADGNAVTTTLTRSRPGTTIADSVAEAASEDAAEEPAVSPERMRHMGALMRHLGMGAADALPFVSEVADREIADRFAMTADEVEQVIAALETRAQNRHEHGDDDHCHGLAGHVTDEPVEAELVDEDTT